MSHPALPATALLLLLAAPLATQSGAQEPHGDIAAQLAKVNATLEDIQTLLARKFEIRSLDLLLQRAKLAAAEVARLDTLLYVARARRASYEDEQLGFDAEIESFESETEISDNVREQLIRGVRERKVSVALQLRRAEADIVDLETRLVLKQQDLDGWQDLLDRRLGGV